MTPIIDKIFVETNLLSKNGGLNPRALEKYNISKELAYQIYNQCSGPRLCVECQQPTTFISFKKGYTLFCSQSCVSKNKDILAKKRETLISNFGEEGFGSTTINNKKIATSIQNYGTSYPRQNKEFVESLQKSFIEKYGVTNPARTDAANSKRDSTNLKKYGYVNPFSSESVRKKIDETNINKYGVKTVLQLPENRKKSLVARQDTDCYEKLNDIEWLEHHSNFSSTILSEQLGVAWSTILNYYKKHNIQRPSAIISKQELILVDFLKQHNINYVTNERTILDGKEIDIYLPEYKIGIEVHGLYWHSEAFIKDHYYHYNKRQLATSKGIQLIQITDYEINKKFNIVKNRILAKLGKSNIVYARKCNIIKISDAQYVDFMMEFHIQGSAPASIKLALTYNNKIVAVMSFSKSRYNKKYDWELIRYASDQTIVGGSSKLFKHFIDQYSPKSIISYADLRWNTGEMYEKIGMYYQHTTHPNYWYIIDGSLVHRSKFQKHKLKNTLEMFDDNLTEWENMSIAGFTRFWDCGSNVYTWSNK